MTSWIHNCLYIPVPYMCITHSKVTSMELKMYFNLKTVKSAYRQTDRHIRNLTEKKDCPDWCIHSPCTKPSWAWIVCKHVLLDKLHTFTYKDKKILHTWGQSWVRTRWLTCPLKEVDVSRKEHNFWNQWYVCTILHFTKAYQVFIWNRMIKVQVTLMLIHEIDVKWWKHTF